jgi:hypothetical protein
MGSNPLKKALSESAYERSGWTIQEHCEHANAQLILNNVNEDRMRKGIPPVHWVIRGGRVVCEWKR